MASKNGIHPASSTPLKQHIDYSYLSELVGHLVGLAHLRATQLHTEMLSDLALTPKQFVALEFISNNPHISQKEIAHHIGTTPAVMVNILDALTDRGLVERVRAAEDRRRHYVRLTEAGIALLVELRRIALEMEVVFAEEAGVTAEERETLIQILRKITKR